MKMVLEPSWHEHLADELNQPYIAALKDFLSQEKEKGIVVYPPEPLIFNAFFQTPYPQVNVVILGQDPYHGPGQAHGLCFSVPPGVPIPPSLKNIYRELEHDLGIPSPQDGSLLPWARQGVLLLNATLTVRAGCPESHQGKGWERFTDAVITCLVRRKDPCVFVLWGKSAQEKLKDILSSENTGSHAVLVAAHPSPLSAYRGFLGCRHFSKINTLLQGWGKVPIAWCAE